MVAVGRKILIAAYFILKDKQPYKDLGPMYLQQRNKNRKIDRHLKQLEELGVQVEIKHVA